MKILIVGLGSIARKHIAAARAIDHLTEFYALRRDSATSVVDGCVNIHSRQEVYAIGFDFAIVSNPTSKHIETIDWLTELRIPLFIEKPLSDNINIAQTVDKCHDMLTYVACNLRFLECLQWVKNNLTGKRINEVNSYCGSYLPKWRDGVDWRKVYSANKDMGGGVHIDLIHEIDYLYWIFGEPELITKIFRNKSSLEIDAVDYANYCLIYANFAVSVVLNYYRRDYKRTFEIVLEDETWSVDLAKNSVTINGKIVFDGSQEAISTYQLQMQYFMDLVQRGESVSMNPIEQAYNVLKICLENEVRR